LPKREKNAETDEKIAVVTGENSGIGLVSAKSPMPPTAAASLASTPKEDTIRLMLHDKFLSRP
jgi:hypothetical protein